MRRFQYFDDSEFEDFRSGFGNENATHVSESVKTEVKDGQTITTRTLVKDGKTTTTTTVSGGDPRYETSHRELKGWSDIDEDEELDLGGGRTITLRSRAASAGAHGKFIQEAFEELGKYDSVGEDTFVEKSQLEDEFKRSLLRKATEVAFTDFGIKKKVEDKQKEVVQKFESDLSSLKSVRQWFGEDGRLIKPVTEKIAGLSSVSYFSLKKSLDVPEEILLSILEELGKKLFDSGVVPKICGVVTMMYPNLYTIAPDKLDPGFAHAFGLIWNYSDASESVARGAALSPGFLRKISKILEYYSEWHLAARLLPHDTKVLRMALACIHNICGVEENISLLRRDYFVSILQPYLGSHDEDISLMTMSIIAAIMDESESEILKADKKSVKMLMRRLTTAIADPYKRDEKGWSTSELARTIRRLARSDAYKRELMKYNVLPALVEMGKQGTIMEQAEVVGAIWVLAFDDNNKKAISGNSEAMELLHTWKNSEIKKIRKSAEGALWTLRKLDEQLNEDDDDDDDDEDGHIMISYNWGHQKKLLKVRDVLKEKGYKVWMDVDEMQGSTLEAMANAVEKAAIVLICMSQKYKDSSNCRAEAEYTFKLGKPVIPLLMEDYKPDGWLGIICGTKLYFDFSGKYTFDDKVEQLLKEMKSLAPVSNKRAPKAKGSPKVSAAQTKGDEKDKQPSIPLRLLNDAKNMFDHYVKPETPGRLDVADLKNLMFELGQNPTDDEVSAIMKRADLNRNGYIDYPEYVNLLMRVLKDPEEIKHDLEDAFKKFTKGSRFITLKQLQFAITSIGEGPLSETEAVEMFKKMDANKDGKVDLTEFVKYLCDRYTPNLKRR